MLCIVSPDRPLLRFRPHERVYVGFTFFFFPYTRIYSQASRHYGGNTITYTQQPKRVYHNILWNARAYCNIYRVTDLLYYAIIARSIVWANPTRSALLQGSSVNHNIISAAAVRTRTAAAVDHVRADVVGVRYANYNGIRGTGYNTIIRMCGRGKILWISRTGNECERVRAINISRPL